MQILIKILISLAVILAATAIGRKVPSTAGLIVVMLAIGVLVLNLDVSGKQRGFRGHAGICQRCSSGFAASHAFLFCGLQSLSNLEKKVDSKVA